MITIEAGGTLREKLPPHVVLDGVETVGAVLQQLQLPPDVALIIMVNGRIAYWTTPLQDGDVLQLLPTIGGG